MAQFIAFDRNMEILGLPILATLESFPPYYRADIERLLKENNLVNLLPNNWYKLQNYLNVLKAISTQYGENTLFNVGVEVFGKLPFPPNMTLKSSLASLDAAYKAHHRNCPTGYNSPSIKLVYDEQAQKAVVESKTPTPCHFERGLITAATRRFTPPGAKFIDVQLDKTKKSRLDGADTSFYIITWF
ncbi:MAG: hypothetical protein PHU06_04140 [Gallionella sp.]|nr:hypothetical protein [Gallionella sp.]MDD4958702.1 hypothetical protein [Gallionella sp.]